MTDIEKLARDVHLDVYGMGNDRHTFKWVIEQFADLILEEAAKVADATVCDTHISTGVKIYGTRAGKAIRALKDKT